MMRARVCIAWLLALVLCQCAHGIEPESGCDVVIAGGSTAAFAAALSSAGNKIRTCLLEPTDWVGGQITSNGLPAIDFAWTVLYDPTTNTTVNVAADDKAEPNVTPNFYQCLQGLAKQGKTAGCWVSDYCFMAQDFLDYCATPYIDAVGEYLTIYYTTVVKNVTMTNNGSVIESLTAITRTPQSATACSGWDINLSDDLPDWYSPYDSTRYTKTVLLFTDALFVDGTEWGELLALTGAPYLQGLSERWDGDTSGIGNDTCGQAATFDFGEIWNSEPTPDSPNLQPRTFPNGTFGLTTFTWQQVWTYRRSLGNAQNPTVGDITTQNWNPGNDDQLDYLFLSRADAAAQRDDWMGGMNLDSLQTAEAIAYGWHFYYKDSCLPEDLREYVTLADITGTCSMLSKVPYLRDTRRTIGYDNFIMNVSTISRPIPDIVGLPWDDRVAIGAYDVDIHAINGCQYPSYMTDESYPVLPYFISLRALTNAKVTNLLAAGKTMGTSFLTNAATRLHPVEWSGGTAAGAIAAYMVANGYSSAHDLVENVDISDLQAWVSKWTPINWTIDGVVYPSQ